MLQCRGSVVDFGLGSSPARVPRIASVEQFGRGWAVGGRLMYRGFAMRLIMWRRRWSIRIASGIRALPAFSLPLLLLLQSNRSCPFTLGPVAIVVGIRSQAGPVAILHTWYGPHAFLPAAIRIFWPWSPPNVHLPWWHRSVRSRLRSILTRRWPCRYPCMFSRRVDRV